MKHSQPGKTCSAAQVWPPVAGLPAELVAWQAEAQGWLPLAAGSYLHVPSAVAPGCVQQICVVGVPVLAAADEVLLLPG